MHFALCIEEALRGSAREIVLYMTDYEGDDDEG